MGAIYAALSRLEDKGYVRSVMGEATQVRGGKRKRHYEVTATGIRMVKELANQRSMAIMAASVAVLAFALALLGVYGVTSFAVSQRAQEVSVRMAIGASAGDIVALLVRQSLRPVAIGLVMPDHFHAVVEGTDDAADLRRFASLFRKRATVACCRPGRRLWQNGYYERVLWPGANVLTVIDYVINNPVQAGLVEKATDYSFSWSVTFGR